MRMGYARGVVRAVIAAALLVACTGPTGTTPELLGVEPSRAENTQVTAIRILGSDLRLPLSSDLDRGETRVAAVGASIGGMPLADVLWRSDEEIEATVPEGLAPGVYDLTLRLGPRGADLIDAFTVIAPFPAEPFGAPVLIGPLSSTSVDDDPSLTADRLELFFNSNRGGNSDLWVSTRASAADPWSPPALVDGVNTVSDETTPAISADGLTLYFGSNRPGGSGSYDIWMTTRPARTSSWSTPVPVAELNTTASDNSPSPSTSQLTIVFNSDRATAGDTDVYIATRASTSEPWGNIASIAQINTTGNEADATIASQDRAIVFHSDRPGTGSNDLYIATRSQASVPFGAPVELAELNTAAGETDPWISDDLRYIVFASDRSGVWELYEASR
jgi:hypothetical protein